MSDDVQFPYSKGSTGVLASSPSVGSSSPSWSAADWWAWLGEGEGVPSRTALTAEQPDRLSRHAAMKEAERRIGERDTEDLIR